MPLSRIIMRLARNPGTEFAEGDDHRGYVLTAPLDAHGHLDQGAYANAKAQCIVRRFAPDEEAVTGHLAHRGKHWFFDYDTAADADDEPIYRLGEHRFVVGEYVTITDETSRPLIYKVMEVSAV